MPTKISVYLCAPVAPVAGLSRYSLCRPNPNPLELLVGVKADSWLVKADENQRQVESPIHRLYRWAMGRDNFRQLLRVLRNIRSMTLV